MYTVDECLKTQEMVSTEKSIIQKNSMTELLETSLVKKKLLKSNSKSSLRVKKKRRLGLSDKLQLVGPYHETQADDEQT